MAHRAKKKNQTYVTPEHIKKIISEKSKGRSHKPRPVLQFDLYGTFTQEWPSCNSARRAFGGCVFDACQMQIKTCYSYQWRYKDELDLYPVLKII